nr:transposase DNA-binding-containing protein [Lautropia mirabilis]
MSRAQDEFRTVDLGNERLNDLAVLLAERSTAAPSESIPRPIP